MTESAAKNYDVAKIEVIAEREDMRVRQFTMNPAEVVPWHKHTNMTDVNICLAGKILVEEEDKAPRTLLPGERLDITPNTRHRVSNPTDGVSLYLLVQFGGTYDFVKLSA